VTARLSSRALGSLRFKRESTFRVLSYYFSVRANRADLQRYLEHALDYFAVEPDLSEHRSPPTPGLPPRYSLVDVGKGPKRYRLFYCEDELMVGPEPGTIVGYALWHINTESLIRTREFFLVHSGAVVTPAGHGLLLPAASGSGKTTLVAGLVRAGFGYLSDEAAAIDPVSRKLYPYPKALTIKNSSRELFGELKPRRNGVLQDVWHVRASEIRPDADGAPCDIRFVVAPRYRPGAGIELESITPAAVVVELWMNALSRSVYRGRGLALLADVARVARGYRLVYGNLEGAVEAIAGLTSAGETDPAGATDDVGA